MSAEYAAFSFAASCLADLSQQFRTLSANSAVKLGLAWKKTSKTSWLLYTYAAFPSILLAAKCKPLRADCI